MMTEFATSPDLSQDHGSVAERHDTAFMARNGLLSDASFWPASYVNMSAWVEHVPFAFWLVDKLKPRTIVELGSHYGVSYFSMCQAVQMRGLDTRCYAIDTWKGDEHAGLYGVWNDDVFETVNSYNNSQYSTFSSLLRSTFEAAVPYFEDGSIDLLHVDGRHHYEDVKCDFEQWLPKLSDRAVVLFHDTNVRERDFGVFKYWSELASKYPHFEFAHGHGLGVLGYGCNIPPVIDALFEASRHVAETAAIRSAYGRLGVAARSRYEAQVARSDLSNMTIKANSLKNELDRRDAEVTALTSQLEMIARNLRAHGLTPEGTEVQGSLPSATLVAHAIDQIEAPRPPYKDLRQRVTARTKMLATALKRLNETDDKIADLEAKIRNPAATVTPVQLQLSAIGTLPVQLDTDVHSTRLSNWISEQDVAQIRSEALRISSQLADARMQLSAIQDSTSWQLTRPLRNLQLGLRRLRRNVMSPSAPVETSANVHELSAAQTVIPGGSDKEIVRAKFDADYYTANNPDVAASNIDPFEHFMRDGWREGRDPSAEFSIKYYLASNPDVASTSENPFIHWVLHGFAEGRKGIPFTPLRSLGLEGVTPENIDRIRARFDATYYAGLNPDIVATGENLFEHFMRVGWREGRDPSAEFSVTYYLKTHADIAASGMNAFAHWVLHGIAEGRPALPFSLMINSRDYAPTICAIIPNYNHARFLARRIESILGQSYEKINILILDDCSTDESREIIDVYRETYPNRVRAIYNDTNSGSVFKQWQKGVENSTSDLVWICESDDYCAPDFIEMLFPYFCDPSVMIAFGRIQQVDAEGHFIEGLDEYRRRAEPGIWDQRLVRPAREWFANGFGVNNVIANVGGCLWRRSNVPVAIWTEAQTYSVVGDWFLYTFIAAGGQIGWDPKALSYFRRHDSNTSVKSFTGPKFYRELESFMIHLRKIWNVPDGTVGRFYDKIAEQYDWFELEQKIGPLSKFCSRAKLLNQNRVRPHILIAFYGFVPGGGELFPINLANALHECGWLVSMLGIDMRSTNGDMKARLNSGIAVYDGVWVHEYGVDRFIREAGISLIHSHTVGAELSFFSRWAMQAEVPYLVTLHGSYEACDIPIEDIHEFAKRVSHFVFTADKNLEPLRACGFPNSMFTKLPNAMPIEDEPFPRTRAEMGIADDATVFTLVARGIPSKGWKASIAAFQKLRAESPGHSVHLLLCGNGEETDRQLALHGDDPDITFLGYQSRIHGLYRLSDVALVPSRFPGESFPLCIIQALQTGRPVLGTRVGEIASMIAPVGRQPGGVVIDPDSDDDVFETSLSEAMKCLLNPSNRHAFAAGARALGSDYSMNRLVRIYSDLYASLL